MRRLALTMIILAGLLTSVYAFLRYSPQGRQLLHATGSLIKVPPAYDSAGNQRYFLASLNSEVDSIAVIKHLRAMYVYRKGNLLKIYRVALGDAPEGHKHFEGDEKTPEGVYYINGKNPFSSCHKNLGISYPNDADRAYARQHKKPTGGDIKIHGLPNGQGHVGYAHLLHDWTNGCIGITDGEIDELYAHVQVGVPVFIMP